MSRILITGMSGTGKSTLLGELARRRHHTVDTDYEGWKQADSTWDESRMSLLLDVPLLAILVAVGTAG
jgi:adenylate kinase family enzyme